MTNDHFSILNFQFTSKDRWPSPLMQPQQNLTCLQRLLVFKDSGESFCLKPASRSGSLLLKFHLYEP